MTNESAINRLLYAILSQKCLKDIDWNKVAHDPILSQEITNGHAARMRYSRFKKQMEESTSIPIRPRKPPTPRRTKVEKTKSPKRAPKMKNRKHSRDDLSLRLKSDAPDPSSSSALWTEHTTNFQPEPTPQPPFRLEAPSTPPSNFKIKTEPGTPSSSSRLSTPFHLSSPSSPMSPTFPTPGVVSLNSPMSSTSSLNNRMMDTSFFGPPLHEQQAQTAESKPRQTQTSNEFEYPSTVYEQRMYMDGGFETVLASGILHRLGEACEDEDGILIPGEGFWYTRGDDF